MAHGGDWQPRPDGRGDITTASAGKPPKADADADDDDAASVPFNSCSLEDLDMSRPTAIVLGNEYAGISKEVRLPLPRAIACQLPTRTVDGAASTRARVRAIRLITSIYHGASGVTSELLSL